MAENAARSAFASSSPGLGAPRDQTRRSPSIRLNAFPAQAYLRHSLSAQVSRPLLTLICLSLVSLIGYLDYRTGYEQSLFLFYLVPIALATWYANQTFGFVFAVLSVAAWVVSDLASGNSGIAFWNVGMGLVAYLVFAGVFAKLHTLLNELDQRVRERTVALQHEIAERERLDREIAEIADRERRRLGQELHDGLCQHLTGTALTAQTLREKLAARSAPETDEADKVIRYIEDGIDLSRNLARGFFSPELEAEGLMFALQSLAHNTTERFQLSCVFVNEGVVRAPDSSVATHLYRIAQEAVMNAIKHADADRVEIHLARSDNSLILTVTDNGRGLPEKLPQSEGLGFRLMSHGASLIGAKFQARRNGDAGTTVSCRVRVSNESD